ncbi:MAG: YbfB/YjiJ family MFS transporter [Hyphomicrobiaceae bacterium]
MFVAMGLGRFSYTAMVPALVESGRLDAVSAGHVGTANLAGFLIGAMLSIPLARLMPRVRLLGVAVLVALAGLGASALSNAFAWLAGWRGLIGVATGIVMVHSLALITESAPADRRAEGAGYVFAGVGGGILSSGILVPALLGLGLDACWWGLGGIACLGAGIAWWGWAGVPGEPATDLSLPSGIMAPRGPLLALIAAHGLFSMGIVPHTLYWVDFLVRGLGLGTAFGGMQWSLVGIFAVLGPFLTAQLARRTGTSVALVVALVVLGLGIAGPWLLPTVPVLFLSTAIFGAQPGISSLMAARARDLGDPTQMGRVMRLMILSNSVGAVAGGVLVPWIYAAFGGHAAVFLTGGLAMLAGAAVVLPAAVAVGMARQPAP